MDGQMEQALADAYASGIVGKVPTGYLRLLDGPNVGRIIIKTLSAKIDGERIIIFADTLTWGWLSNYANSRCEQISPTFPPPNL